MENEQHTSCATSWDVFDWILVSDLMTEEGGTSHMRKRNRLVP